MDQVISWAIGGTPDEVDNVNTPACATWNNNLYYARVNDKNQIEYLGPDVNGWTVVDSGSNVGSGLAMVCATNGKTVIAFTNHVGDTCKYERQPGASSWQWARL